MRFVWAVAVLALATERVRRRARRAPRGGDVGLGGAKAARRVVAAQGAAGAAVEQPGAAAPAATFHRRRVPRCPARPGCYTRTAAGWIQQPCNCEMPLDNITHSTVDVRIALTVDPATVTPSLTGSPAMQVTFGDSDGSWFATWSAQPNAGTAFAVTTAGGSTTVRLGAARVDLAAVPLPACLSRMGMGDVGRTSNVILDMEASFISGGDRRGHRSRRLPVLHAALTAARL